MLSESASVLYRENPGRGTKMLCPGLASTEIQISSAPEHPLVNMTSCNQRKYRSAQMYALVKYIVSENILQQMYQLIDC